MLNIIKELRQSDSRLHKEAVLAKHRNNEEWKAYLKAVYDPFITYGKAGDPNGDLDDLDNLKLLRSLKAGVTATAINKVYGKNFISKIQPMKAGEIGKQFILDDLEWPMIAQIKYDGFLTHSIVKDGEVTHYTSNGHPWKHIDNKGLENAHDGVYISELIGPKCEGKLGDRRFAAIQTTFRTNTAKGIKNTADYQLRIFDYIPLDDFYKGECKIPYRERINELSIFIGEHNIVESRLLRHSLEGQAFLMETKRKGYEGLVLKSPNMYWRASASRRKDFVKFKHRKTGDFLVVEEVEGDGKYQGLIGSLIIADCAGNIVGSVGSGLSDMDRHKWDYFIGRVVEVQFEQVMDDKLIQPTLMARRADKDKTDIDCIKDLK